MLLSIKNWLKGPYFLYNEETQESDQKAEPVPRKWLPGDTVDPTTGTVVTRNKQDHRAIVGIIDFANRTGQGFTSRNIPLYMFHPLNQSYPPMIVSSKTKPANNQLASIHFEHWDEKWPRAGIHKIMGPVGNIDIEKAAHIQAVQLGYPPEYNTQTTEFPNHDPYEAFVFHIDPEGCGDVDDVLSFKIIETGYEFGIGIADVSAWIQEDSEQDMYAKRMGQTIYIDGKPLYPMLPQNVSADLASLKSDGRSRPVLSRVYKIQNNVATDVRWSLQMLKVDRTYTYESILNDPVVGKQVKSALVAIQMPVSEDPHQWIEAVMIAYNEAAANLLKQNGKGLLRSQPEGIGANEWKAIAEKSNHPELAFFGYGAGKYVPAKDDTTYHTGLNLQAYTHASSPLRRYADLHNQRHIKHILFGTQNPKNLVNWLHLNERSRLAKQLDRDLWFLSNLQPSTITEVRGIVLQKRAIDWTIYVPCWKRKIKAKTEEKKEFQVGEEVNVRAYTNLKAVTNNRIVCSFQSL